MSIITGALATAADVVAAIGLKANAASPTITGTMTVNGVAATGLGTAIGNILGPLINYSGSGLPGMHLSSRLIFDRAAPASNDFADWDIRRATTFTGGTLANINASFRVTGTIGANDATQNWLLVSSVTTNGTAGGLVVAGYHNAVRAAGATDAIWGTISAVTDANDTTSSLSGKQVIGHELDMQVNRADDATNSASFGGTGTRKGLNIAAIRYNTGDTVQTEVSHGLWFSTANFAGTTVDAHTNFQSAIGFAINAQIRNALDTRGAITPAGSFNPVSAVTMTAGHVVDFNGGAALTSAPGNYWWYDIATSKMKYNVGATCVLSIDNSGNVRALGTITGSVTP